MPTRADFQHDCNGEVSARSDSLHRRNRLNLYDICRILGPALRHRCVSHANRCEQSENCKPHFKHPMSESALEYGSDLKNRRCHAIIAPPVEMAFTVARPSFVSRNMRTTMSTNFFHRIFWNRVESANRNRL